MEVGLEMRGRVVVDDNVDLRQVEAARRAVRAHENVHSARPQLAEHAVALVLGEGPREFAGSPPLFGMRRRLRLRHACGGHRLGAKALHLQRIAVQMQDAGNAVRGGEGGGEDKGALAPRLRLGQQLEEHHWLARSAARHIRR